MSINYLALAIPAFFLILLLEYIAYGKAGREFFNFSGSVRNLSTGIAERLLNLYLGACFYLVFKYIYQLTPLKIPSHWYVYPILLLLADFIWYWYHRMSHEVNIFWAAHIVHHQSEEFNYTVSARITSIQALVRNVFWCLLPLAGFDPDSVIIILAVHGAYSFFTHTQLLKPVPWLEKVLITPSLHGVHHASNQAYLDKNYGDVFVFWDKLFGTFSAESEKPVYGLTHQLKCHSFLWQHAHYFLEIAEACKKVPSLFGKLKLVFGPPSLLDQNIRPALEKRLFPDHNEKELRPPGFRPYLIIQLTFCVLLLTLFTLFFKTWGSDVKMFVTAFILLTVVNCGAIIEQHRYVGYLENIRAFTVIFLLSWHFNSVQLLIFSISFLLTLQLILPVNRWYDNYVLKLPGQLPRKI